MILGHGELVFRIMGLLFIALGFAYYTMPVWVAKLEKRILDNDDKEAGDV